MAQPTDDQQMEMDMVMAMFGDHFTSLPNDKHDRVCYSVGICHSGDDTPDLKVTITYPADYPESASPEFLVESVSNKRRVQCGPIMREVKAVAEESMGMHCVTNVLQHIQNFLEEDHETSEKAALTKLGKEMAAESKTVVKSDPTIRMGNIVTPELFKEWQVKHLAEKAAKKAVEMKKLISKSAGKMSGRQIWDTSIKDTDWQLFEQDQEGGLDVDEAGFDFELHDEDEDEDKLEEGNYDFEEDDEAEE